ncbi:hypothetical protein BG011_002752, partial [Mortierella polycephala]
CADKPYKIPEGSASQFAFYLCNGLDPAHPFKKKDKEPPETIDEAIKQIEDLSRHNRWNDVETFEARATKANQSLTPAIVEGPVLIGGVQVAAERYSSFKEDFGNDRIDELNMEELTDMFSSWTLAAVGEPASEKRAAGTISRMNKAVARRRNTSEQTEQIQTPLQRSMSANRFKHERRPILCATPAMEKDTAPRTVPESSVTDVKITAITPVIVQTEAGARRVDRTAIRSKAARRDRCVYKAWNLLSTTTHR